MSAIVSQMNQCIDPLESEPIYPNDEAPLLPRTETYMKANGEFEHSPPYAVPWTEYRPHRPAPIITNKYLMDMDAEESEQYAQALANGCIN